jgi:cytochrome c peroxidase
MGVKQIIYKSSVIANLQAGFCGSVKQSRILIAGFSKIQIASLHHTKPALMLAMTIIFVVSGCQKENTPDPTQEVYNPTPYELVIPTGFPDMVIPEDNPMTAEGVELGRRLFYDPILSADNTQSCGSCHAPEFAFTDNGKRFSTGIDNIEGNRNSMALINGGWMPSFFWDGRRQSLEDQALDPVTNPIEMHETWSNATEKLNAHPDYPDLFFNAFGTRNIDSMHVVKAIAQFERTLISSNSKWDRYLRGEVQLSQAETKGFEIFFTEKGDCFHCHTTILFTDNIFHNNGLDSAFTDKGLFDVTGNENDIGKFKTPTLRNIKFTKPYMHDGRFAELEDVVDFYSENVKWSATIDPLMKKVNQGGIQLTEDDKLNLIAFILALSDTTFINNPDFSNPFEND